MKNGVKYQHNNGKKIKNPKKNENITEINKSINITNTHNTQNINELLGKTCKFGFSLMGIMIIAFFIIMGLINQFDHTGTQFNYILNTIFILYAIGNITFLITSFILLIKGLFDINSLKYIQEYFIIGLGISILPSFGMVGCDHGEPILCIVGKIAGITIIYCIIYCIIGIIIGAITKPLNKSKSRNKKQK